jgi:hypothetical protein
VSPNNQGSGGLWCVHPGTRCLTAVCDEGVVSRLGALHSEFGVNLVKRRHPRFQPKLQKVPELTNKEILSVLKLEHEMDHLQKHLATSYGNVMHLIQSRRAHHFFTFVGAQSDGTEVPLPLMAPNPMIDPESPSLTYPQIDVGYEALEKILTCGSTAQGIPNKRWARSAKWLWDHELFRPAASGERGKSDTFYESEQFEDDCADAPLAPFTIAGEERTGKFGAHALLEAFALSREITLRSYACLEFTSIRNLFQVPVYQQAWNLWKQAFTEPLVAASVEGQAVNESGVFPREFYLAADLALWLPVCPKGLMASAARPLLWKDIHLGGGLCAFLKFCDAGISR